ncbi:MAG: hypothetical protein JW850_15030 [Thermoflexales bacterium]|nr:hypothetical protein [Thermoflexales bacterium]
MVDQLASEYAAANKPVVFIEQNVDAPLGSRSSRWWAAHGAGSATLPLSMVDSGNQISSGYLGSSAHYSYTLMVDAALARPPQADIQASSRRVGNRVVFEIRLTNLSTVTLSSSNAATVHAIVYEEHTPIDVNTDHITGRIVRAAVVSGISPALAPSATTTITFETGDVNTVVDWSRAHALVLADYRPGGSLGAYDMLQAAFAPWPVFRVYLPAILR